MQPTLPIDSLLPEILRLLERGRNLVIVAEPASGKTTRIPPACLQAPWLGDKKILMLEPRRIAARAAANFIAQQRRERVGETIGYRVRNDTKVSKATRLEIVTEGILTRMIQQDPSLDEIGMIIFDEFHERSIHVDLALALTLEVQRELRPDLRLAVMSATIDAEKVAALVGDGEILRSPGQQFPVELHYLSQPAHHFPDVAATDAVRRALREAQGDILVFLPGHGDIQRTAAKLMSDRAISETQIEILRLHSEVPAVEQDRILNPSPGGKRRVILATNIAETSVTIPHVRIVIDSGLMRVPKFNLQRGISGLQTATVSQASATQRAGRAGREGPGVCYRLWTERAQQDLAPFNTPEILSTDLASFLLELAVWGSIDVNRYSLLTPPLDSQIQYSRRVLELLDAIGPDGKITHHGRTLLGLSLHPRLANMLVKAKQLGFEEQACDVIALLEEHTVTADRELDQILSNRFESLRQFRAGRSGPHSGAWQRIDRESQRLRSLMGASSATSDSDSSHFGILVALAFPDRIAARREPKGLRYLLRSGTGADVPENSPLAKHEYLAIAQLDGSRSNARVFLAEPILLSELETAFDRDIERRREIGWDMSFQSVRGREIRALGSIVLSDTPIAVSDGEATPVLLAAFKKLGLAALPFQRSAAPLRDRAEWLRSRAIQSNLLPDLSEQRLMEDIEEWLSGFLDGFRKLQDLKRLNLDQVLAPYLTYQTVKEIERLAPEYVQLPSGRSVSIDYTGDRAPCISGKLQEFFGVRKTPTVADGRIPLTVHLLSPAGRPLQVTADLESFWKNSYEQVRKEMQGRYPKHSWPLDPLTAEPTRGAKRRSPS